MIPNNYDEMKDNLEDMRDMCEKARYLCWFYPDDEPCKVDAIYTAMCGIHDAWIKFDTEIRERLQRQLEERLK